MVRGVEPRRVVGVLAGVVAVAMAAGCGSHDQPLSAPVASMDELHGLFTHAASSQLTWTVVQEDRDGRADPSTMTCGVQVNPIQASDCRFSVNARVGDGHALTFPDAEYIAGSHTDRPDDGLWYRYSATDNPELANSLESPLADLGIEFFLLPRVATIAASHADRIDGRSATRHDLAVDTLAPRALPGSSSPSEGDITESVQIWIGARDLPVRTVIRTQTGNSVDTLTTNYRDWGQSLDIKAPPADKTRPGPPH